MADVHVYVTRPSDTEGVDWGDLEESLQSLDHVSEVRVSRAEGVVAVSFEGGQEEQEEIERAVEEAGFEVSRISVRTTFAEE